MIHIATLKLDIVIDNTNITTKREPRIGKCLILITVHIHIRLKTIEILIDML